MNEDWWPGDDIPPQQESWRAKGYQTQQQESLVQDIIRKRKDALMYLSGK